MFRRVFVPVDGSADARAAARLAARLAKSQRGRLHACYVVDRSLVHGGTAVVTVRDRLRTELHGEGQKVLRSVAAFCRRLGVPFSETLAEGEVVAEIVKASERFRADVMVVSTRGLGPVKALLLGSLVLSLVSRAGCPVLLVRRRSARRLFARPTSRRRGK